MDPYDEQRLINEVIYLHYLWHQGPPRPPQLQPTPSNYSSSSRLLHHPSNPTQFKKGRIKRKWNEKNPTQPLSLATGKEWPCNPSPGDPPATTSDWNKAWPKLNSVPLLSSPQEKGKLTANQAQSKALKVTKDYFFTSDDDDDDDFMEEDDGCEEYGFFVKLFAEDNELREFYNKNYKNGEFVCLVCGGLGKKLAGKKYKGCIALVQHSISIAKTKKRRAHRAYGHAICKILGWDIDNLSSIVAAMAENHKQPLNNADQGQAETLESEEDAPAKVGEGDQNGLAALESKDGSVDAINLVEGEVQAILDEGDKDGSAALKYKEGSMDVTLARQGEANVGEGTKDSSTNLERKDAPVDACNGGVLPVKESFCGGNSENDSGSTLFEQNSGTEAAGCKSAGDFDMTVPVVVEGVETEMLNHHVEPSKDGCIVSDEGKNALLDDLVKNDATS